MNAHISNSLQFRKTQEIAVVEDLKDLHCLLVFSQRNETEHFI